MDFEFTEMIKIHEGTIYKIILSYTNKADAIQDLYQEVVYQLWKSYTTYRGDSKLNTWLYRVVLNTVLSQHRNDSRRKKRKEDYLSIKFDYTYDHELDEKIKKLYKAIYTLNDIDKAIIMLHLESKSHKEISEIIGITITNVGTKISRIKSKLHNKIQKL
ncbi:MAG: RNA polymerase sigma factor [Saprospiraceae bacterium]|nr:RNA polymerase sigma factor [Saprospiraceae bacterium]